MDFEEKLNKLGHKLGCFQVFTNKIAKAKIKEFAPPFLDYQTKGIDILTYCNEFFKQYIDTIAKIDNLNIANHIMSAMVKGTRNVNKDFNILEETESVCKMIFCAFSQQFKGFPSLAFEEMEKAMTADDNHLLELLPQLHVEKLNMFRVRKGNHFTNPTDLFHLPYELRTHCNTYRFSTLGYPSLYMAGSLDTALKETNAINRNEFSCICFRVKSSYTLKFIDLSLPHFPLNFWESYSLLVFYPLIVACGLKVRQPDAPFKPEYVIPQLLFQVIRLYSNFDGVSYTSTKDSKPDFTDSKQRNYVMYVPYADRETGYSTELAEKLESTKPLSCNIKHTSIEEIEKICSSQPFQSIII